MLCYLYTYATSEIKPGLFCSQVGDEYIVELKMPELQVGTDTLKDLLFSKIIPFQEDQFDYLGEDGRPELPFYSVNLILPPDVSGFQVTSMQVEDSVIITLPLHFTPAQERVDFDEAISFDSAYYQTFNTTWYWKYYDLDESNYRGQMGLAFSVFPFHYEPQSRKLVIITKATYVIDFVGSNLESYINTYMLEPDLAVLNFYDNFSEYPSIIPPINGDEYLIIADDHFYNDQYLLAFVDHKESLGYNVTLTYIHDIGSTPIAIRSYIQNLYQNRGLKYVLLVGDVSEIPFSAGVEADVDDPPTDIFYSCLSKTNISDQWRDLNPSVFVGRWPILNTQQLRNIVEKSIVSDIDLGYFNPSRIGIFTGQGSHEDYIYKDGKYLYKNFVQGSSYYTGDLIDGRTLSTPTAYNIMKNYLETQTPYPTWIFIYRGHGNPRFIGEPYYMFYHHLNSIVTNTIAFQSFGFGFACLLGDIIYEENNFARYWVTSEHGGVSFLGASTNSYMNPNRYFSRKLFWQLENKPIMTIGEFVGNGKAKYYNADKVVYRRRQAKKYVLYGDPSLYLFGIDVQYEAVTPLRAKHRHDITENIEGTINIDDILDRCAYSSVESVKIYNASGQLMLSDYRSQEDLVSLPSGIYIVKIITGNTENISHKIVIP